jgi:hypothetical protein
MPDERVGAFLARSHRRVVDHCDALLARPLPDEQRSRLVVLREAAWSALPAREAGPAARKLQPAG